MLAIGALVGIVFLAFFTESVVGFGATVITVSLAAHFVNLDVILPAFVPLSALLSLTLVTRHRTHVDRQFLWQRLAPAMAVGMAIGMVLFRMVDSKSLLTVFGVFVSLVSLRELLLAARKNAPQPKRLPAVLSFALLTGGGVIHGMFGSGGPLVVYVVGREVFSKAVFRATLSALWLASNVVLVVGYVHSGMMTRETATLSAWMVPALLAGLYLGEKAHGAVNERTFRLATWVVLLAAALSLAVRSLVG